MDTLSSKPSKNNNNPVPAIPPLDPASQRQRLGWLAWMRMGFGALSGLVSGALGLVSPLTLSSTVQFNDNAWYGVYIAIFVYIITYYIAKYTILKGIAQKDRNALFTKGIGSYVMVFLFTWIIINTFHYCTMYAACKI